MVAVREGPIESENCPNKAKHTPAPTDALEWAQWADTLQKQGYIQRQCTVCMKFVIWTKRKS